MCSYYMCFKYRFLCHSGEFKGYNYDLKRSAVLSRVHHVFTLTSGCSSLIPTACSHTAHICLPVIRMHLCVHICLGCENVCIACACIYQSPGVLLCLTNNVCEEHPGYACSRRRLEQTRARFGQLSRTHPVQHAPLKNPWSLSQTSDIQHKEHIDQSI